MEKKSKLASFLSGIYVIAAICLLLKVCMFCYPNVQIKLRETFAGREDSRMQTAFHILADGLAEGEPIKETVMETFAYLTEDAD